MRECQRSLRSLENKYRRSLTENFAIRVTPIRLVSEFMDAAIGWLSRDFKLRFKGRQEDPRHFIIKNLVFEKLKEDFEIKEYWVEVEGIGRRWSKRPNVVLLTKDNEVLYIEVEMDKKRIASWSKGVYFRQCLKNQEKWRPDGIAIGAEKGMFLRPNREGIAKWASEFRIPTRLYEITISEEVEDWSTDLVLEIEDRTFPAV